MAIPSFANNLNCCVAGDHTPVCFTSTSVSLQILIVSFLECLPSLKSSNSVNQYSLCTLSLLCWQSKYWGASCYSNQHSGQTSYSADVQQLWCGGLSKTLREEKCSTMIQVIFFYFTDLLKSLKQASKREGRRVNRVPFVSLCVVPVPVVGSLCGFSGFQAWCRTKEGNI